MRLLLLALFSMIPLLAQVPQSDARNGKVADTDTHFTVRKYTRAEWDVRREQLKQRILFASGLAPMPQKTALNPRVTGRTEGDGYVIERVLLETMPGFYLGGNLYRPKGAEQAGRKVPAILHPHGHWTYGRLENQPLYSAPTFGINLAKLGFVVFAYDMVGYNDTPQVPHRFTGKKEQLWQFTPLGLQLWNSIRVVDYLETLPDVDPKRIGASGASGGGTQTFLLAAVDDRIAAAAPVNMVSLIMQGGCICENAPHLRVGTHNVETAAIMAPRPQLVVAATGDWTRNVPKEEFPALQEIYALYGAKDKVEAVQFEAPHNYHKPSREAVYNFFRKTLQGIQGGDPVKEANVTVPDARDLLVLWNSNLPANAKSFEELFGDWRQMSEQQAQQEMNLRTLRERLAMAVEAEEPGQVLTETTAKGVVLSRGEGDRIPVQVKKATGGVATILVHPGGAEAAMAAAGSSAQGSVYAPDLYLTGSTRTEPAPRHTHHATFHPTDDAYRVRDLLTTIAYVKRQGATRIRLQALGDAGPWAILAAAVSATPVELVTDPVSAKSQWDEDEWLAEHCFIPGLQRAGGLRAALRVAAGRGQ
jgi:dienelactone hydrolase